MTPRDLLKSARKACSGDLLDLSNAEARRRARAVLPFCDRADATAMVRTLGHRTWDFAVCVGWARDAKWPYHLREACEGFHRGLRQVANNVGGLDRLLTEMSQREL